MLGWLDSPHTEQGGPGQTLVERSRAEVIRSWPWQTLRKFWKDLEAPTAKTVNIERVWRVVVGFGEPTEDSPNESSEEHEETTSSEDEEIEGDDVAGRPAIELDDDAAQHDAGIEDNEDEFGGYEDEELGEDDVQGPIEEDGAPAQDYYGDLVLAPREVQRMRDEMDDLQHQHREDQQSIAKLHTNVADWRLKFEKEAARHSAVVRALQQRDLEIAALRSKLAQRNDGVQRGFNNSGRVNRPDEAADVPARESFPDPSSRPTNPWDRDWSDESWD